MPYTLEVEQCYRRLFDGCRRDVYTYRPRRTDAQTAADYANDEERVWLVDEREQLVDTYLVSGRENVPAPGTYAIFSKSVSAWAGHDGITMKWMARFTKARSGLAIGFHGIPVWSNGQPMQTEDELGYFRSGGCVRQSNEKARALYEWAPIGTTVIVLP